MILQEAFSLADQEFIWAWPLIRFYQMLGGGEYILTADFNRLKYDTI